MERIKLASSLVDFKCQCWPINAVGFKAHLCFDFRSTGTLCIEELFMRSRADFRRSLDCHGYGAGSVIVGVRTGTLLEKGLGIGR
jgi:hypothetical protein